MKADKTNKERQARRRVREKQWLLVNGWKSWEAVHTSLLSGVVKLVRILPEKINNKHDQGSPEENKNGG